MVMVVHMRVFYPFDMSDHISICEMVVNDTVDGKNNLEEITREVADNRMYHFGKNFLQLRLDMLW